MRISDWSSDVCSPDLRDGASHRFHQGPDGPKALALIEFLSGVSVSAPTPGQASAVGAALAQESGRASGRERECPYVWLSVVDASLTKKSRPSIDTTK